MIKDTLSPAEFAQHDLPSGERRFYRGRNTLQGEVFEWKNYQALPADTPFWDDMIHHSALAGLQAARQSLKPAFFVWGLMALIAVLYYAVPSSQVFFSALSDLQAKMTWQFPFFGMGLSVGLLAEAVKVSLSREKRWMRQNTVNAMFNLTIFGFMGVLQHYFYQWQGHLFGDGASWRVVLPKVLLDQFVWTVFFANPYQTVLYLWKNQGFSWSAVRSQMRPFKAFWGNQILPVLITNWAFWIPMVAIIYCFPKELQLPLAILAVTIWVLLLSILTSSADETSDEIQEQP
jgi:hypothetical protein